MKRISIWARSNPGQARILLLISNLLLLVLALIISANAQLPPQLFYPTVIILFVIACFYQRLKRNYLIRKSADLILAMISFLLMLFLFDSGISTSSTFAALDKPDAASIIASFPGRDKNSLTRYEKKVLRKEFKVQLKNYAVAKIKRDTTGAERAIATILIIIAMIGLFTVIAALSCSLICNGSVAAGWLLLIFGGTAVFYFSIYFLLKINRRRTKKFPASTEAIHLPAEA